MSLPRCTHKSADEAEAAKEEIRVDRELSLPRLRERHVQRGLPARQTDEELRNMRETYVGTKFVRR